MKRREFLEKLGIGSAAILIGGGWDSKLLAADDERINQGKPRPKPPVNDPSKYKLVNPFQMPGKW